MNSEESSEEASFVSYRLLLFVSLLRSHCNTLQHTDNTLQHIATQCTATVPKRLIACPIISCSLSRRSIVCGSVLQCVAVCHVRHAAVCQVMQCVT